MRLAVNTPLYLKMVVERTATAVLPPDGCATTRAVRAVLAHHRFAAGCPSGPVRSH